MTPERWAQLNQLFHAALEREPGVRSSFLAQSCAGDEPMRSEVESLLASHLEAESFIEIPASDVAAELFAGDQGNSLVGKSIGHYEIEALLGAGGMGEVYLAQDNSLGRRIAVKLLPQIYTLNADRVSRFEQEARAASALNHPNIVTIHEIGRSNSSHFIATEFIDGETLRQHMTGRPLTLTEVLDIAIQVASALEAAHSAGIVHRDIKPENIMLRRDGFVKVLDFGLAKLALQEMATISTEAPAESMVDTDPGMVMGTVRYMSPEQARGKDVDARTDIWSLGIVLFEMITGRVPFEGETRSHVVAAILESEPPPILHSDLPAELERIVCKALLKTLDERY
ncbi:MAG: serine/threonine-protein kinase, partial [Pyrinomonadaceae bacterium]